MKHKVLRISLLLSISFLIVNVSAQNKKNSILIGGSIAHYIKIEEQNFEPFTPPDGYYNFPISPGLEFNYLRKIAGDIELGTGISFQKVHVSSFIDYIRRFRYNELCIPLLIRKSILLSNSDYISFSTGVYFGKQRKIESDYPTSYAWDTWEDLTSIAGYSEDVFFTDFYLDAGFAIKLVKNNYLILSPYMKYRFNETWLNYHQNKFHYGFKLNYSLNF